MHDKIFTLTNIIGLSIGFFLFLLIFQFVVYQKSFDESVSENVYRCYVEEYTNGSLERIKSHLWLPFGSAAKDQIPGIKSYLNLYDYGVTNSVISYQQRSFYEPNTIAADSSIIPMFGLRILKGQTGGPPDQCIISEAVAKKYFGNEDPIGKVFHWRNLFFERDVRVSGVFENRRSSSHIDLDFVFFTMHNLHFGRRFYDNWEFRMSIFPTYFELEEGVDPLQVEQKFAKIINENVINPEGDLRTAKVKLQRVRDIHLNSSQFDYEQGNSFDKTSLLSLNIMFIILIFSVWMNYFSVCNLKHDVHLNKNHIRRSLGASNGNFFSQIAADNIVLNLVALVFALILVFLFQPHIFRLLKLPSDLSLLNDTRFYSIVIVFYFANVFVFTIVSFILFINKLRMSKAVHKFFTVSQLFTNAQLVMVYIIITGGLFILKQINLIENKDLGFNKEEIIMFKSPFSIESLFQSQENYRRMATMRTELLKHSEIVDIANMIQIPGYSVETKVDVRLSNQTPDRAIVFDSYTADENFFNTHSVKFLAGETFKNFDGFITTDYAIINRKMLEELGFKNPKDAIGEVLISDYPNNVHSVIVGVVENMNHKSLHTPLKGTMYIYGGYLGPQYSLRFAPGKSKEALSLLESEWKVFFPAQPLDYYSLSNFLYRKSYSTFFQFFDLLKLLTLAVIIITCIGLLCFIWQVTHLKLKDIAIRKTLGASELNIYWTTIRKVLYSVLISIIIAAPITYYIWNNVLSNFQYRVELELTYFLISAIVLSFFVVATVSFTAVKAALTSPVKVLREL
jgi:putative ABC transport system permease protein